MSSSNRMAVLKRRGKGRLKLRCHCQEEFWVDPARGQNIAGTAGNLSVSCPRCACRWDGQDSVIGPDDPHQQHSPPQPDKKGLLCLRMAVQVGPEQYLVVRLGKARSVREFLVQVLLSMPDDLAGITISAITPDQYRLDRRKLKAMKRLRESQVMEVAGVETSFSVEGKLPPIFLGGQGFIT